MSLNINLFVHGVPMGQKIWGPKGDDQRYISSFYGPKWDVPEVMRIEVMTFANVTYCYYSFIIGQNVCDSQGRAGSYFALTLRINAFYSDVQNLYNILKATYDKLCIGLCLKEDNGIARYLLADFMSVDQNLKQIETQLMNYISEFSVPDDIINISDFQTSNQSVFPIVNLHQCTKQLAFDSIKKNGKLMVSPWYLDSDASRKIAQYKSEVDNIIQNTQQELQVMQKSASEKIEAVNKESEERIASILKQSKSELLLCEEESRRLLSAAEEKHKREINLLKDSYKDVDFKIYGYKQTIKQREQFISDLQHSSIIKDKELQENKVVIRNLERRICELQEQGGNVPISYPSWLLRVAGDNVNRLNRILIGGCCVFFAILLISVIVLLMKMSEKTNLIEKQKIQVEEMQVKIDSLQTINHINEQKDLSIIIQNLPEGLDSVVVGKPYILSLSQDIPGEWMSKEFIIEEQRMIAKREMAGKEGDINYISGDSVLATMHLYIKEKDDEE